MIKVKISTQTASHLLLRQTHKSKGVWGKCQFYVNQDVPNCNWWIVYDGLLKKEVCYCPPKNLILITAEPPSIKKYNQKYLDQFATVITSHQDMNHPHKIFRQQSLPWGIGIRYSKDQITEVSKGYDELMSMPKIHKTKLLSVISSYRVRMDGHKARIAFVEKLKTHFGNKIDFFGAGINHIPDKWDGIAPYKYHITLENSVFPDYWTEKLADVFLSETFPIYYGCPNLKDYFPNNSYQMIDINSPDRAIKIIEKVIKENYYEKSLPALAQAKSNILNKYNLFAMLSSYIEKQSADQIDGKAVNCTIKPEPLPKCARPSLLSAIYLFMKKTFSALFR